MRSRLLALAGFAAATAVSLPASAQYAQETQYAQENGGCGFGGAGWDRGCSSGFRENYPAQTNTTCPPGQIPHVFPNGNGYRCTYPDGSL